MGLREDMEAVQKELNEVKQEILAMEFIKDYKKQCKRYFIMWIITFIALVGMTCYLVWLLNDITITESYEQEISKIETIDNSSIINGGN